MLRVLIACFLAFPLWADTVYLHNGTTIDGVIKARHEMSIELEIGRIGRIFIELATVASIEKNNRDGTAQSSSLSLERKREDVDEAESSERRQSEADDRAEGAEVSPTKPDEASLEKEGVEPELRKKIENHVYQLTRQKRRNRVRAERQLMAVGEPAIPFLLDVVTHENHLVRLAVLRIFSKVGNEAVIPATIDRLEDENGFVRSYAAETVRELTGQNFGFDPEGSPKRRQEAVTAWRKWYEAQQAGEEDDPEDGTAGALQPVARSSR
jgi:hypothetical protein